MYEHIGVPVDLAHRGKLDKALRTAGMLAATFRARISLLGVTAPQPTEAAHSPKELAARLEALAAEMAEQFDRPVQAHVQLVGDPASDLDKVLNSQFHSLGVDLVVMASHVPGFRDYIFHSHAGFLASHTDLSVFVVRDQACRS